MPFHLIKYTRIAVTLAACLCVGLTVAGQEIETPSAGSSDVPLDSWVYPALDRLAALGAIHSQFEGLRPWTRLTCAQLVKEAGVAEKAGGAVATSGADEEIHRLYGQLLEEFAGDIEVLEGGEQTEVRVDSMYTRFTGIAGPPLRDSFHFGQTVVNDSGRPYGEGFSTVTGGTVEAVSGPFYLQVQGEYQHAPSFSGYTPSLQKLLARIDGVKTEPSYAHNDINQFQLIQASVGFNWLGWQTSFGSEPLWWGPTSSGPFLFSDNAAPVNMLRSSRIIPMRLPGLLHFFGPIRSEFFVGELAGHHFPAHPWIHGEKFSFKPTTNLEFGFSRTVVFAGTGHPFTPTSFLRSFFSVSATNNPKKDPGDRRMGFDLTYRLPFVRNWVTFYTDSFVDDDPLPLAAPGRAAINPGFYFPRIPKIPKLDLRGEAVYTAVPAAGGNPGQFFYWNLEYRDAYLNNGTLMGNWIGREGMGFQAWSTYWFSPRSTLQLSVRNMTVHHRFIPGGGNLQDLSLRSNFWMHNNLELSGVLQYEQWNVPLLAAHRQNNFLTSVQFTFHPSWKRAKTLTAPDQDGVRWTPVPMQEIKFGTKP
jgi:hypothetical protein